MNESSPTLEDAISLALEAHRGQTDKAGAPYILHPLRMMLRVRSPTERMVALLHDVVEDSDHTLEDLRRRGFPGDVVAAFDALTRRKGEGETYEAFVWRAARHPVARQVKIADLEDNLDLSRIAAPGDEDRARMERYQRALAVLQEAVGEGDEP